MKKIFTMLVLVALGAAAAWGQEYSSNKVTVNNLTYALEEGNLLIDADLDFSNVSIRSTETQVFTVVLFNEEHQVDVPVGTQVGRRWYYHYARERRDRAPFGPEENMWYWKDMPNPLHFAAQLPYEEWMKEAALRIDCEKGGCCGRKGHVVPGAPIEGPDIPEPEPVRPVYKPVYVYELPPAETTVKQRDISGEAYVVFATGKTEVDPYYKDNQRELGKIRATIDSVRMDQDMTITRVLLRGYSSPDGSYATNEKLAAARTRAIKNYVSALYGLPEKVYVSESVAENWKALREAVAQSNLSGKDLILEVIDGNLDPDKKEARIKKNWPKQWKQMAQEMFPLLRRTDYKVSYTVRSYTTAEDARRIMRTHPEKLSINEFFLAAQGYEMGTREFDEVFAIASRMYPDNEVVNVNAANAALSLGNFQSAEMYLDRAGDGAVARYTRGVMSALQEDWESAVMYFMSAKASGVPEAGPALEIAQQILNF